MLRDRTGSQWASHAATLTARSRWYLKRSFAGLHDATVSVALRFMKQIEEFDSRLLQTLFENCSRSLGTGSTLNCRQMEAKFTGIKIDQLRPRAPAGIETPTT